MKTYCGKIFNLAGTAHRKCGAKIYGTDRRFQCDSCRNLELVRDTLGPGSTAELNDKGEVEISFVPVPVAPKITISGTCICGGENCREANQKGEVVVEGRKIYYPDLTGVCMGYPTQDPNEKEVDQILARLESYYRGDELLARGAKHLSVSTDDLRTLTDYIKYLRGQLRSPTRRG